jgi:hypothetical protein
LVLSCKSALAASGEVSVAIDEHRPFGGKIVAQADERRPESTALGLDPDSNNLTLWM